MKRILKNIKSNLAMNLMNIPGWRTNRKIVVFESDDWGSIRMPSKKVYEYLLKKGIRVDNCPFSRYDSLASEEDLIALIEILLKHKGANGQSPVITINTVVANPNFKKIKDTGYSKYHFEVFTETLKKYPKHNDSFKLWKEGIDYGVFHPQLHGREHLQVNRWLKYLKAGSKETIVAFQNEMFGISTTVTSETRRSYLAALDYENNLELDEQKISLIEAQSLFNKLFNFPSRAFIAANYTWGSEHEATLSSVGIKYLQGTWKQILPIGETSKEKFRKHFSGEFNNLNQLYLVRNCSFEPSAKPHNDVVAECIKQINKAFSWNKPAIIGTHRLNFIGYIDENNRNSSLKKLNELLTAIISIWPDIEFVTSDTVGKLIENEKK